MPAHETLEKKGAEKAARQDHCAPRTQLIAQWVQHPKKQGAELAAPSKHIAHGVCAMETASYNVYRVVEAVVIRAAPGKQGPRRTSFRRGMQPVQ